MNEITTVETAAISTFDYSSLSESDRAFVEQQLTEIEMLLQRTWVEVAQRLIAIRDRIGDALYKLLESDDFQKFAQFGLRKTVAYEMVRAYSQLSPKLENFPQGGESTLEQFRKGSLRHMVSAPEPIRDDVQMDAIARANRGETISANKAKEIVESHKQKTALSVGQSVAVVDPDSDLFGQTVIIEAIDTYTVDCKVNGKSEPIRFIVSDVSANPQAEKEETKAIAPIKVKPNVLEQLESENKMLKERETYLIDLIGRCSQAYRRKAFGYELLQEMEDAIA